MKTWRKAREMGGFVSGSILCNVGMVFRELHCFGVFVRVFRYTTFDFCVLSDVSVFVPVFFFLCETSSMESISIRIGC